MRWLAILLLCLALSGCAADLASGAGAGTLPTGGTPVGVTPRAGVLPAPIAAAGVASPVVVLGAFSGRPDPAWELDPSQTAELTALVEGLSPRAPWPGVDMLAPPYYGFRVTDLPGGTTLFAYRDVVRLTTDGTDLWLADPNCAVEAWLLASGDGTLAAFGPDLIALVHSEMGCQVAPGVATPGASTPVETPNDDAPALALYLTPPDIRPGDLITATDLAAIPLLPQPLLTVADFASYDPEHYTFVLTPEADARIAALDVPVAGRAFVLYAAAAPVYTGAFWAPYSSLSYDGVTIWVLPGRGSASPDGLYRIVLGYPGSDFFRGPDPRGDPRVAAALADTIGE